MEPLMPSVLVVDDDKPLAEQLHWALKDTCRVAMAHDRTRALNMLRENTYDLLLVDLCLPPENVPEEGFRLLRAAKASGADTLVVVMSGIEEREAALRAIAEGAYDFFSKPFDIAALRVVVGRAIERLDLERENRRLREELTDRFRIEGLIGVSPNMRRIFDAIRRVANSNVTVSIQGESGTGKELVARAIHFNGVRKKGPFLAVHCAALPETLLEAELFGHEKGAFTGAVGSRVGRFEAADGGTLFLDEIACLTPATQVKLLRVLEERTVERLGSNVARPVDIRLIVASNEDLEGKARRGEFREDLFFRVNVFPVRLPRLRDRQEDIPLLAAHFLRKVRSQSANAARRFSPEALEALTGRTWPGNVRELLNVVETAALLSDGETIEPGDLPPSPVLGSSTTAQPGEEIGAGMQFKTSVEDFEKRLLLGAIGRANGVKARAGRELGLDPSQMKYLAKKYGL